MHARASRIGWKYHKIKLGSHVGRSKGADPSDEGEDHPECERPAAPRGSRSRNATAVCSERRAWETDATFTLSSEGFRLVYCICLISRATSSEKCIVKIRTSVEGDSSRIRRINSRPFYSGMVRSRTTRSGRSFVTCCIASTPLAASAQTSNPGCDSISERNPRRTIA